MAKFPSETTELRIECLSLFKANPSTWFTAKEASVILGVKYNRVARGIRFLWLSGKLDKSPSHFGSYKLH